MKTFSVKSIFGPTLQGEGHRAGTTTMFVRLAGCNLQCVDGPKLQRELRGNEIDAGFFCDTDFAKGERMTVEEIDDVLDQAWPFDRGGRAVVISGGEPALQLNGDLIDTLQGNGWYVAIETNGTIDNPAIYDADWISCSPKGETKLKYADEVRCVLEPGNAPNDGGLRATKGRYLHRFVSPRFESTVAEFVAEYEPARLPASDALAWAIHWCLAAPEWRLSVQQHKAWGVE